MSWWRRLALADIDVPARPVSHTSHPSTDVPPAGSPPPDISERPLSAPSAQPLSDDSSSQPPSDVAPSSVPLSAPPHHRYRRYRRHRCLRILLVCLLLKILRCGLLCILRSLLKIPLSSLQTLSSSHSLNLSSSLLSPPPAPLPVLSPPSSVLTGTPTASDLQLAAEVLSQSPLTVSDEALAAMEISEVSPAVSPPPSQNSVRAFVSRVASKSKPASLDPADGPSLRKSTTPLPVSSGRKTNNPRSS